MIIRCVTAAATTAGTPPVAQNIVVGSGAGSTLSPKGALYELTSGVTLDTAVAPYRYGIGMTDGNAQRVLSVMAEDGNLSVGADSGTRADTATVINFPIPGNESLEGEASWVSWQAGGSQISWADLLATAAQIKATYFYGDDVQCAVVEVTGHQNTNATVTGLDFEPDLAIVIGLSPAFAGTNAFVADDSHAFACFSLGYAVRTASGGVQQVCYADLIADRRASTTGGASTIRDDAVWVGFDAVGATPIIGERVALSSWTSDGAVFAPNGVERAGPYAVLFVGFTHKREMYAGIRDFDETSAGDVAVTDPGFKPEAYFAIGTYLTSKNTLEADGGEDQNVSNFSHGAYTGTESVYASAAAADAVATSDTSSSVGDDFLWRCHDGAGSTTQWRGTHVSLDATGFTVNIDGAFVSLFSKHVAFIAIGPPILDLSDTEQISDQVVMAGSVAFFDTEQIADEAVLVLSADDLILVLSDMVEISDQAVISGTGTLVFTDTVEIADETVFSGTGNLVFTDSVEIEDGGNFAGSAILALSDTVEISDQAEDYLGLIVVSSDTVEIADEANFGAGLISLKRGQRGATLQGGAEDGTAFQGGAERGTVLG
jgi:hypothetical protein